MEYVICVCEESIAADILIVLANRYRAANYLEMFPAI